jgi:hypothetical protein
VFFVFGLPCRRLMSMNALPSLMSSGTHFAASSVRSTGEQHEPMTRHMAGS